MRTIRFLSSRPNVPSARPQMCSQSAVGPEAFVADETSMRFLAEVFSCMPFEFARRYEARGTLITGEGSFTGVRPPVYHQTAHLAEASLALVANVWLLAGVNVHVESESARGCEACCTLGTCVRFFAGVSSPMTAQTAFLSKCVSAHITNVRFFAGVNTNVPCQLGLVPGPRRTARAGEKFPSSRFLRFTS